MKNEITLPTYLIAKDDTGTEFLIRINFPKFIAIIDRSINIASTQLIVLKCWDEISSMTVTLDHARLWLQNRLLKEMIPKTKQ